MNIDFNIPTNLFTMFNKVKYFDEPHEYHVDSKIKLVSATTLLHKYVEPFDEEYWSNYKAQQYNLHSYEVKRAWKFLNLKGTFKGSIIHDYTENLFLNKVFKYPKDDIIKLFGFDPIINEYNITKNHVDNFYRDSLNKLIPIKTELVVYDTEALIGGMVDMLFYNVKKNEFQIWDWKTNKDFTFKSERKMTGELYLLDDCDLEMYSLQLSMYKYIIEKYTNVKIGDSYLVWFSHNNPNYQIIKTNDRSYFINQIVNERMNEIKKATIM